MKWGGKNCVVCVLEKLSSQDAVVGVLATVFEYKESAERMVHRLCSTHRDVFHESHRHAKAEERKRRQAVAELIEKGDKFYDIKGEALRTSDAVFDAWMRDGVVYQNERPS